LIGIELAARSTGYWVSIASLPQVSERDMTQAVAHFIDQSVEGTIVIAPNPVSLETSTGVLGSTPAVMVSAAPCLDPRRPHIDIDQELGARLAVRHLIDLGHTRIAHFMGPGHEFHAQGRRDGWERELADHGIEPGPLLAGTWAGRSGYDLARRLLGVPGPRPTAVFAANDLSAMGAVRAFSEAGLKVGHDISVIGFDDSPGIDQLNPPLTTVRQDFAALGRSAFDLLRQVIGGESPQASTWLAPELVARSSSGRAARA
jgi:LacI family transcriptional regulator